MNRITLTIILLITIVLSACSEKAELGSSCELLRPTSEGVTKVEQKNLDCSTLDSDALCMSYLGNEPYCTQKCGPTVETCSTVFCENSQTCVEGVCYERADICSTSNPNGVCKTGMLCNEGSCVQKSCTVDSECSDGFSCVNSVCEASGCPENYDCLSPIQLLGHPFNGVYLCVEKKNETTEE
ncbi:hypothetical protein JXR93_11735 [bacterium]|nr:hypothetical protein [bacterium]